MYLYLLNGVPKNKSLVSQHMYLAPGVEMVLLIIILAVVISSVGVMKYPEKTIKLPPPPHS